MWILLAFLSALFAGATSILAKLGIRDVDSHLATALRTAVVLLFSWLMVFVVGSWRGLASLDGKSLLFLILSGLTTGASWLCYFRALQLGSVCKVVPVDKTSTLLTMLLAALLLGEPLTLWKLLAMAIIGLGTWLMLEKKTAAAAGGGAAASGEAALAADGSAPAADLIPASGISARDPVPPVIPPRRSAAWLLYACLSALFASLTAILGKIGISGVESNLGTAIRTCVVLIMAWLIVFLTKKQGDIRRIDKKSWLFLILSGAATGMSWLCYYRALQLGQASIVAPIDKLSLLVTVLFAWIVLKERPTKRYLWGLLLVTAGTLSLLWIDRLPALF